MKEDPSRTPFDYEHPSRAFLLSLIGVRITLCLLGVLYLALLYSNLFSSVTLHYATLLAGCGVNLLYLVWMRYEARMRSLAQTQILVDLLLEAVILYLTGGIFFSVFSFLFFATVLYAPLVDRPRTGLLAASVATVLISAVSITYFLSFHWTFTLPFVPGIYIGRFTQQLNTVLPYLTSFGVSLHLVGFLAGRLVRRVSMQQFLNRELLENIREGVGAIDLDGTLYLMNKIAARYLNCPPSSVEKALPLSRLEPTDFWTTVAERVKAGKGGTWDVSVPRDADASMHLEVIVGDQPTHVPGHLTRRTVHFLFLRDITARVEAEEQRTRAEKLETISNLGSSIAHEIRNPLSSIRGAIQKIKEDLAEDGSGDETNQKLLDIVHRESERVNRIIDDFLNFSRERPMERTEIRVRELIDEVREMVQHAMEEDRDVRIDTEMPEDLEIQADRDQITQVFYNLLLNGVEHTENGGTVRVRGSKIARRTLQKKEQGAHASRWTKGTEFEVMDEGPGIPEEERSRVFEPFYTGSSEGTGLGLAITAQIVHRHDGNIETRPRTDGTGTIFEIWLPDEPAPV